MVARLTPGLSVGGVGGHALCDDATSARLTPELSVGKANGRVGQIFSPVSRRVGVILGGLVCRAAAASQVPFERYVFSPPE